MGRRDKELEGESRSTMPGEGNKQKKNKKKIQISEFTRSHKKRDNRESHRVWRLMWQSKIMEESTLIGENREMIS